MHKSKNPFYKSVYVKETCKVAEISDAFGQLRYKVQMTSFDIVDDGKYELAYQVQVVNYFYGPEPLIIFEAPDVDEPPIKDINVANKIYAECVKNYTMLVKAETRDFQDIDVYKERIQYRETCPECCATCRWCKSGLRNVVIDRKLHCINPKNKIEFKTDIRPYDYRHNYIEDHYGHRVMPDDHATLDISPKVMPFGVCMNYEKALSLS